LRWLYCSRRFKMAY